MARKEHWTLFRNGFLIWSGFEPTQDGGGPRVGMVGEGEEAGEVSIMALAGVVGAVMLILGAKMGMLELLRVGGAMVGRGWISGQREAVLIDGWD